ncbi:MAG: hypothetical protein WB998_00450 [Solirubrobacteraceae bacterium]
MDRTRLLGSLLATLALTTSGCSSIDRRRGLNHARGEVRTPAQALQFLTSVARKGNVDDWVLAAGASLLAKRVWSEREAIENLGLRIREEGGEWGCELAASSYRVGHVGIFTVGDREALASEARVGGAKQAQVEAFFADMLKMSMGDLRSVTVAVCSNPYLE